MERCGKKVMIQLMVGNYLRYTDRSAEKEDFLTSAEEKKGAFDSAPVFDSQEGLVNPLCLPSASESESCSPWISFPVIAGSCSVILSIHFACHRLLKVKVADGRFVSESD